MLASTKCNLARRPTSLLYRIESDDESQSLRLTWEGTSDLTCDNLLVTV